MPDNERAEVIVTRSNGGQCGRCHNRTPGEPVFLMGDSTPGWAQTPFPVDGAPRISIACL